MSSRRPCDSDALATSSYGTYFAHPLSAATFVSEAVKVVLPWSMCPIVPTFTCGFERSNFSFAICVVCSPPSPLRGYGETSLVLLSRLPTLPVIALAASTQRPYFTLVPA